MTIPVPRHRLMAIMAADAVGFSRLMSLDDQQTVATLDVARGVFRTHVQACGGRVIDVAGDSVLAAFDTALGAVQAALAVQRDLAAHAARARADRRMDFRIGVHLGDVIEKDDGSVYGDGVNIAARLQGIAEPGGIVVSQAVQGVVLGRVAAMLTDLGEQVAKNIAQPVRAFRVEPGAAAGPGPGQPSDAAAIAGPGAKPSRRLAIATMVGAAVLLIGLAGTWTVLRPAKNPAASDVEASADAGRLSIVVLPFANLTGDAGQAYFADGLTATLTADLSRIRGAFVIDAATAQSYKGKPLTAQEIGKALGVRFVLQGSVQRSGERFRINAQLADTSSNAQLWSDSFQGDTSDLFALQDQVTGRIANTMDHELVVVAARESERRKDAPHAADLMLRARALADKPHSLDKWQQVEALYRQALVIDPGNVNAMMGLATALSFQPIHFGPKVSREDREKTWSEAVQLAGKVHAIDPDNPEYFRVIAFNALAHDDIEGARRAAQTWLTLTPRMPDPYNVLSNTYTRAGEPRKAIELLTQAITLDRKNANAVFPANLANAYFMAGDNKAAIAWNLKALEREPTLLRARIGLAMAYALDGDDARAQAEAAEVRRLNPGVKFDVQRMRAGSDPSAYKAILEERMIPGLRKAGLLD